MPVAFWTEFQNALRARDAEKIAGMTSFPADIGLAGIEEFEGINQREGFIRHFDTIFPEEAVATLLAISASSWEVERPEESGRAGHHWSVSYHNKPAMSEGEFGIYYIFSPMPDGSVRLTAVDFVG